MFESINTFQIDIYCMSELGLCWPLLPSEDNWFERTKKHFRTSRSCISNNCTELSISRKRQYGGTGILVTEDLVHRVSNTGRDPTGLGRWATMSLKGKNHTIRIISSYRPCHSPGPETVYAQHSRYFHNHPQNTTDPRQQFLDDLSAQITEWQTHGDLIILCMDANDDI